MLKRSRHIFYTPGLISLLILPIICIAYLNKEKKPKEVHVIEINWWHSDWNEHLDLTQYPFEIYPPREYFQINLLTKNSEKKTQLEFFQLEIRRLLAKKDTINGVHIRLNDSSTYGDLISILNIFLKEKARTYVIKENDVWFFNFYPRTLNKSERPFRMDCCRPELVNCIPEFYSESESDITKHIEFYKLWPIAILYVALATLGIRNIKQDYKE